jgi:ATP/maltotriose-dependent transcriptional regulator MalT
MRAYGLPVRYLLRFLSYLIAAFQMLEPALGNVALAMLHTPQPPSLEAVLTILANDLVSHQHGAFTIVLHWQALRSV